MNKLKGFAQIPILIIAVLLIASGSLSYLYINETRKNNALEKMETLQRESEVNALKQATEQLNENLEAQQKLEEQKAKKEQQEALEAELEAQQEALVAEQKRQEEARLQKIAICKTSAELTAMTSAEIAGKKARDAILTEFLKPSDTTSQTLTQQLNNFNVGLGLATDLAKMAYDDAYSREYSRVYLVAYSNCLNSN